MEDTTTSDDVNDVRVGMESGGVVYDTARPDKSTGGTSECSHGGHDRCICGMDESRGQMKYNPQDLIDKLVVSEGLRLQVYKDTLGIDTIGIGRNLEDRGITQQELDDLDIPSIDHVYEWGITEADAVYLAENDVQIVEEELVRAHPCVDQLDAVRQLVLVDMAFNMGVPRLSSLKRCGRLYMMKTTLLQQRRCLTADGQLR